MEYIWFKIFMILVIQFVTTEAAPVNPTEDDFTHDAFLDEFSRYRLFWKFDSEKIVFEVHVQTTGYVGFGFSPNGGMPGSDIVIGWVKSNGKKRFTDQHALHYGEPRVDDKQDYKLLYGAEIDDHTILKFERKLDTCDDAQDWMITGDTVRLIWAYHPDDPEDDKPLPWHGRESRGSRSVYLLDQPKVNNLGDDVNTFEILQPNVKVPSHKDTTYMCLGYHLPRFNGKQHVIKYEPVIQPGNEAFVHHFIVYQCSGSFNESAHISGNCGNPNMPDDLETCSTIVMAWAVGGGAFYFPDNAGFSLGGPEDPTFILFETHYDNSEYSDTIYDSSGLRVYYTSKLREYDATLLTTGGLVTPLSTFVPPQSQSFKFVAHCSGDCTENALTNRHTNETTELHIFAGVLHSHLAGHAIRVRHIRDGVELPNILVDNHYDFNYQEMRTLREEVIIQPGDNFIVECEYSTMDRQTPTWGGLGTKEEMCLAFFYVYPRTRLFFCESSLIPDFMAQAVGVSKIKYGQEGQVTIEEPTQYANISFYDYLNRMNWTDEAKNNMYLAHQQGMYYEICSANFFGGEEGPNYYFPEPVTDPLPDYIRQCNPEDEGNGGNGNGNGDEDELQFNGCSALSQYWAAISFCVLTFAFFQ
ncbi:DBH-like monooxygenase protein 1 [Glandiceps talaboti]